MKLYTEEFIHQVLITSAELASSIKSDNNDDIENFVKSMIKWCDNTFGYDEFKYMFIEDNTDIYSDIFKFKKDSHRTLFILKFSL